MSSSNRHWPSMFKSKPCNTHHQWQHDINPSLMSSACQKAPYTSGDANVFYWFQNRKSRSKHKLRNLQNSKQQLQQNQQTPPITNMTTISAPSSSSSSSEKSSPKGANKSTFSLSSTNVVDVSSSPTASVNQTYFHQPQNEFLNEPFSFPMQQPAGGSGFTQAFGFSELTNVIQVPEQTVGPCTSLLLSEILTHGASRKGEEKMDMQLQLSYSTMTTAPSTNPIAPHTDSTSATVTVPSNTHHIHGVGEPAAVGHGDLGRSTVFINDVAFEVTVGPFNVREAFGDDAILINSSGQPVLTNEWGLTLQSLQHGLGMWKWKLFPLSDLSLNLSLFSRLNFSFSFS
ncbi:hypothetical protein Golob_010442 [Gossypium lobatum]|uniref:Homeobox domain-containing protein n=1 Tax=Gossypium lobatum TaxID=34289 RepID=A0A7J8MLH9_9ROSI|nr:hypothetical protein [Gossypium lobatum]